MQTASAQVHNSLVWSLDVSSPPKITHAEHEGALHYRSQAYIHPLLGKTESLKKFQK